MGCALLSLRVRLHKHNLFLLFHSETKLSLPFCFFPEYEPFFLFPSETKPIPFALKAFDTLSQFPLYKSG